MKIRGRSKVTYKEVTLQNTIGQMKQEITNEQNELAKGNQEHLRDLELDP